MKRIWDAGGCVFTIQCPPTLTAMPLIEQIAASGFDAALNMDAPGGAIGLSGLAMATLLKRSGVESIIHLGGRDRNRLALQSDLLSQGALGIPNLLIDLRPVTRASFVRNADARLVTDLQGLALLDVAIMLRDEARFLSGASIKTPPALYIGIYSDLAALETHMQTGALNKAQYVITTPILDARSFADRLATFQNAFPDFLRTRPLLASLSEQAGDMQHIISTIEALKGLDGVRGFNIVAEEQADLALLASVVRDAGDR